MSRKFTKSRDGVERATVVIRLRLSREELEDIKNMAAKEGDTVREWLENHAALGIEEGLLDVSGEYEQRYGKGDGE